MLSGAFKPLDVVRCAAAPCWLLLIPVTGPHQFTRGRDKDSRAVKTRFQ